jgi:hypothetical protein
MLGFFKANLYYSFPEEAASTALKQPVASNQQPAAGRRQPAASSQ